MNKTAIKNFAIWARNTLLDSAKQRAYEYEIEEGKTLDENQNSVGGKALSNTEYSERKQLVLRIKEFGFQNVMEEVAYTWFNRFTALRFMEVNGYLPSKVRVFTDEEGKFKPDILKEALTVEIEGLDREKVIEYMDSQKNEELYKYLIITQCNALNSCLPEMFEKFGGWTELLFPANLLREGSVLQRMVEDIPEDDWKEQVQIIGWLYQYYITEQNALVYDGTLSKAKIPKELISAATTIYTPDWSVRYMVDNTLGKLWVESHSDFDCSCLKYYLAEPEQENNVQEKLDSINSEYKGISPESIQFLDSCMGSGHILVYGFDVLMQIYLSQGYSERDAAVSIIQNNLYGMDIDKRAYQLAYFTIMMKGRAYDRRFFSRDIKPNLCYFSDMSNVDVENINEPKLREFAQMFENADTIGSLLEVKSYDIDELSHLIENMEINIFNDGYKEKLEIMLASYKILSNKYDVITTNPPYLGSSRFAPALSEFVNKKYPDEKSDLSMAMYRKSIDDFAKKDGYIAFITTSSWFFLSSFEKLRLHIINNYSFDSIVDYGTELFDGKVGHNPIVSWVTRKTRMNKNITAIRLVDYCYSRRDEKEPEYFESRNRYYTYQSKFKKIPGSPVAYWVSENFVRAFEKSELLTSLAPTRKGMFTGDNNLWLRLWYEIGYNKLFHQFKPYNKGGEFNKWYGNHDYVVNWKNNGEDIKSFKGSGNINDSLFFRHCITWSLITSSKLSFRAIMDNCHVMGDAGPIACADDDNLFYILGALNSKFIEEVASIIAPTLNCSNGVAGTFPIFIDTIKKPIIDTLVEENIEISKKDWNSFETSWDFEGHPLV